LISLVQQNRLLSGGPTSSAAFSRNVSIVLSKTVCWPDGSTGGALIMSGLKKSAESPRFLVTPKRRGAVSA
jgi:hypothetical protein